MTSLQPTIARRYLDVFLTCPNVFVAVLFQFQVPLFVLDIDVTVMKRKKSTVLKDWTNIRTRLSFLEIK